MIRMIQLELKLLWLFLLTACASVTGPSVSEADRLDALIKEALDPPEKVEAPNPKFANPMPPVDRALRRYFRGEETEADQPQIDRFRNGEIDLFGDPCPATTCLDVQP